MDTLYRLLEWNPVQVGSTFQGGGWGGVGGVGGVFDLKNQGLGFAPGRKKPCYRKSNSS